MRLKSYDRIGEQVYSETLPNGLKVIAVPKRGFTKSFASFATNYGGADRRFLLNGKWTETPAGVAHFLEHKMFETEDGNALSDLSANGASPNAFTSSDITFYHFQSTEKFVENLRILLRFVSVPYFTEESVRKEQGIIGQEIRMTEDSPRTAAYYGLMRCLYSSNPVRDPVAGTVESIAKITPDLLYGCHRIFYNPSNMALCAVGNVDPETVIREAENILPREAAVIPVRDYGPAESPLPFARETQRAMAVSRPQFLIGAKNDYPGDGEALRKMTQVAELACGCIVGSSTPLYTSLYADGLITSDFTSGFDAGSGTACTIFRGESDEPHAVLNAILKEAERIAGSGPDEALFERVRKARIGACIRELNSFDSICYNQSWGYFHGYDPFEELDALDRITPEDVRAFAAEQLCGDRMAISVVTPSQN